MTRFVYLASQSPRRKQLLEQLGVRYEMLLPEAHEDAEALEVILPGELPLSYVKRVTQLKHEAALLRCHRLNLPVAPVLCADTTVALGDVILGKPRDALDASEMLQSLSGKTHDVFTAVVVGTAAQHGCTVSSSRVTFANWSKQQIQSYVATGEPMGKAGAYAIQGRAAAHISNINGSYSGIMGLPVFETAQLLSEFGFEF